MPEHSKGVANRSSNSRTVRAALEVNRTELETEVPRLLFPDGVPKGFAINKFFDAMMETLGRAEAQMNAAEESYAAELADDAAPRSERDLATGLLREHLFDVRDSLSATYGRAALADYALASELPVSPEEALQRGKHVAALLRKKPLAHPAKRKGITIDVKELAKGITEQTDRLDKALADVKREQREAQSAYEARNAAMESWSSCYQAVADITTGLFELIGRQDLAGRVRPTARKRAGIVDEPASSEQEPSDPENPA